MSTTPAEEVDWQALVAEHSPSLRRVVARRAGAGAVDDVLQETFLRAFRSRHCLDAGRPVGPWLRTIAIRVATDTIRRAAVASRTTPDLLTAPGADEELAAMDRVALIEEALGRLKPRHRSLLEAVALDGTSQVTIAERDGVAPEVIRSTVLRARQRFRTVYERLAQEQGLLGAGGSIKPTLARLRVRLAAIEPTAPRKAELAAVLVGLIAVGSSLVTQEASGTFASQPRARAGEHATATQSGGSTEGRQPRETSEADIRIEAGIPGANLGGGLAHDGPAALNTWWTFQLDYTGVRATVQVGTDDSEGGVHALVETTDNPYGGTQSESGLVLYCYRDKPQIQASCAVFRGAEDELRSVD